MAIQDEWMVDNPARQNKKGATMGQGKSGNSKQQDQARRQGNMSETGQNDSEATSHKYGQEFYEEIGQMGGQKGAEAQPREAKAKGGKNSQRQQ
jgi:hypothetical protein